MKAQRFGDVLLKSRTPPLFSFLTPSVSTTTWSSTALQAICQESRCQQSIHRRGFATQTSPLQASAATAAKREDDGYSGTAIPSRTRPSSKTDSVHNLLNSMKLPKKAASDPPPRSPVFNSPSQLNANKRSSPGLVHTAISQDQRSRDHLRRREGSIADEMMFTPEEEAVVGYNAQNIVSREATRSIIRAKPPSPPIRLDAFVGRSEDVDITRGMDLARSIRKLEIKCAYNNVRKDFAKQRFHERAGLKRKRLKSERWRKRFKEGFQAVVKKVKKMRKQGW